MLRAAPNLKRPAAVSFSFFATCTSVAAGDFFLKGSFSVLLSLVQCRQYLFRFGFVALEQVDSRQAVVGSIVIRIALDSFLNSAAASLL